MSERFWEDLTPDQLSDDQWEGLCDHCGRCCLHKIEDIDTGEVFFTDVACQYMDEETCSCPHYQQRQQLVPECLSIKPDWGEKFNWLPNTCAYRLLYEGKSLPDWHPLVSGDENSVHLAGISIRGRNFRDNEVDEHEIDEHVIDWVTS